MAWECRKNVWYKGSKEVSGRTRREKKGRPRLTRMEDVGMDLRNMGVKIRRTRTLERTK
jgi:hypothetical protein